MSTTAYFYGYIQSSQMLTYYAGIQVEKHPENSAIAMLELNGNLEMNA